MTSEPSLITTPDMISDQGYRSRPFQDHEPSNKAVLVAVIAVAIVGASIIQFNNSLPEGSYHGPE